MDMYQQQPGQSNWLAQEQQQENPNPNANKSGLAVASFVLGLVSFLLMCCCCVSVITAPLSIIFAIISLAGRRARKGFSIAGIIFSSLSIIVLVWSVGMNAVWYKNLSVVAEDYTQLAEDANEIFPAYEESGEIPEFLEKYTSGDFQKWFDRYDMDFNDIMDWFAKQYDAGMFDDAASGERDSKRDSSKRDDSRLDKDESSRGKESNSDKKNSSTLSGAELIAIG